MSSTSLIISGSSADVGSSNSITFGLHRQRPGDRHALLLAARELARVLPRLVGDAHPLEQLHRLRARPPRFGILRTWRGASVMLSSTVRCGNRLKLWNTMPVSRRISWMLRMSR